jgi:hypothetical protein
MTRPGRLRGRENALKKAGTLRLTAAVVGVVALSVAVLGGAASAKTSKRAATTITMEKQGRDLFFVAPDSVEKGAKLKIENLTNPNRVGPHTFTLVKKSALPSSNNEFKKCGEGELPVCAKVFKAHEFDPKTFEVGKANVDAGKKGWDASFSNRRKGDSWYSDEKNQTESRKVKAEAGKKFRFFCVIHPFMQGKIKVEG